MPSRICCANNHATKTVSPWEAAVALSSEKPIGVCKKCGEALQYRIESVHPQNSGRKDDYFVVTRSIRLGPKLLAGESYDPFLLVLCDKESGAERIMPAYWSYEKDTAQRGGQFSPLLSLQEWRSLFRRLDATFDKLEERIRIRAFELYERRGKTPGRALEDWLQAEAELTGWKMLHAA
ncbi:MAG: DUF2934 domain-containing protein [Candidatus Acidiferrales bacterium]